MQLAAAAAESLPSAEDNAAASTSEVSLEGTGSAAVYDPTMLLPACLRCMSFNAGGSDKFPANRQEGGSQVGSIVNGLKGLIQSQIKEKLARPDLTSFDEADMELPKVWKSCPSICLGESDELYKMVVCVQMTCAQQF